MAEKGASKNNKKPLDGAWTCKGCGQVNTKEATTCVGVRHTRLLRPVGRGMRAGMVHDPCGGAK